MFREPGYAAEHACCEGVHVRIVGQEFVGKYGLILILMRETDVSAFRLQSASR